jgi:hypothetical protein
MVNNNRNNDDNLVVVVAWLCLHACPFAPSWGTLPYNVDRNPCDRVTTAPLPPPMGTPHLSTHHNPNPSPVGTHSGTYYHLPNNFNWFLHSLLFLHTQSIIKAQKDKAKKADDDDDETDTEGVYIDRDE